MKTTIPFVIAVIICVFIVLQPVEAVCQGEGQLNTTTHFVVIGAFAIHSNAERFVERARQMNLPAKYMMNPNRNLYYVYVFNTENQPEAVIEALRLRKQSEFAKAWVYHVIAEKPSLNHEPVATVGGVDTDVISGQNIDTVKIADPIQDAPLPSPQVSSPAETGSVSKPDEIIEGANFYFKIFRTSDNKVLEGEVDVIDLDRTRKIGTYKGNMGVKVGDPASKSDNISLVSQVFGYRKIQRDVNFNSPEGEGIVKTEKGLFEIPFEMVRLRKGDIAVMYNVFFYKDAAIMRPESRFEVTALLEMMKENPRCKIKIHGHANGGGHGKIITMEDGGSNFFTLTGGKEGFGSSTQLSEERAKIIRDYLISNGVEENRTQIKAWGGKRPIHDKDSARAQENVRVEIEILEN